MLLVLLIIVLLVFLLCRLRPMTNENVAPVCVTVNIMIIADLVSLYSAMREYTLECLGAREQGREYSLVPRLSPEDECAPHLSCSGAPGAQNAWALESSGGSIASFPGFPLRMSALPTRPAVEGAQNAWALESRGGRIWSSVY